MGMTFYTAHVYVKSEEMDAYFELTFDNEKHPEIVIDDSIADDFADPDARKDLISNAFDANGSWDDEEPYTLADEIDESVWMNDSIGKAYKSFCETVKEMNNITFILFAVDSDTKYWMDYSAFWFDATVIDCKNKKLTTIEWRGTQAEYDDPFDIDTAKTIIEKLSSDCADQIDTGDFVRNGKRMGHISSVHIKEKSMAPIQVVEKTMEDKPLKEKHEADSRLKGAQKERVEKIVQHIDNIDFDGKNFVFARNPSYWDETNPKHPLGGPIMEKGGQVKKSVSGKTNYFIVWMDDEYSLEGAKVRDALAQIDKGKPLVVITHKNLEELLKQ